MSIAQKLIRVVGGVIVAALMSHAHAVDKTRESASPRPKNEVVKTTKEGIEVREVKGAEKMDRERRELRKKEKAGKK